MGTRGSHDDTIGGGNSFAALGLNLNARALESAVETVALTPLAVIQSRRPVLEARHAARAVMSVAMAPIAPIREPE
jgi:hypothetical protein